MNTIMIFSCYRTVRLGPGCTTIRSGDSYTYSMSDERDAIPARMHGSRLCLSSNRAICVYFDCNKLVHIAKVHHISALRRSYVLLTQAFPFELTLPLYTLTY